MNTFLSLSPLGFVSFSLPQSWLGKVISLTMCVSRFATPTKQVYPYITWKENIKLACVSRRSPEQVDLMELARQLTA